jgi:UDP-N-acetylglucosamine--N-acetylmuramyl-(pentapeptide) pyrophosphoryl-undecaprenol N-acetylglucosamine transferase
MKPKKHLLVMAGGTGGHIFPGLAIAHAMQQDGWQISWLGAKAGLEDQLVPAAGFKLYNLAIQGLRGKTRLSMLTAPWRLSCAVFKAWRLLHHLQPSVVIGFGGYASGPGGVAAWLLRIPLIIHEQNAIAGLTNRLLAKLAWRVLQAFPSAFVGQQALTVGNPIREELIRLPSPALRFANRSGAKRLLVLGGSRGALALNQTIAAGLAKLPAELRPEVWHQTGAQHLNLTQQQYAQYGVMAKIEPFIQDIGQALAWADLVICRAGALTISELAMVGVASILVPYPHAADDHQTANAKFLVDAKAAIVVAQADFTPQRLAKLAATLLVDRLLLTRMAKAAYSLRLDNATECIKQQCENLLEVVQ